ncbi:MAG: undecaprenyldiphospho-muramoylpentapeptide beta-N-acetylglucosaminyltransferase [Bacteroidota bacterium]
MLAGLNKVLLSAGGTGGHIFPAIAVANEIKKRFPNCEILFVGANGRMEMEKVPQCGFEIIGLPIAGLQRKFTFSNLTLPFKIFKSIRKAKQIVRSFKPDVVVGFGGYASGPTLRVASRMGIPTVLQEQNSYAGVTNKLLAKLANKICVSYSNMDKFFPEQKIVFTGNPVRSEFINLPYAQAEAKKLLGFDDKKKLILVIGGSLGARAVNEAVISSLELWDTHELQLIWQCGRIYKPQLENLYPNNSQRILLDFIKDMALVYAAADIIVSRAGAMSVSELCLIGKPVVFMPSPNVAEDHQTKNAMALVNENAAVLVKDEEGVEILGSRVIEVLNNQSLQMELARNIRSMAKPNATNEIVDIIFSVVNE